VHEGLPCSHARAPAPGTLPAPVPAPPSKPVWPPARGIAGLLVDWLAWQAFAPRPTSPCYRAFRLAAEPPLEIGFEAPRAAAAGPICLAHRAANTALVRRLDRLGASPLLAARVGGN
jgi:hypothetical protein